MIELLLKLNTDIVSLHNADTLGLDTLANCYLQSTATVSLPGIFIKG